MHGMIDAKISVILSLVWAYVSMYIVWQLKYAWETIQVQNCEPFFFVMMKLDHFIEKKFEIFRTWNVEHIYMDYSLNFIHKFS